MTTKLKLYNQTLRILGERKLARVDENRSLRHVMDDEWDDDFVDGVLDSGYWNFAMRTAQISYNPSIEPDFGYQHAFDKPSDWIRTWQVSGDEYFHLPLNQYADEQDYWFSDLDVIYVRYVSNDDQYGANIAEWPHAFAEFAAHEMAWKIVRLATASETKKQELKQERKEARAHALSVDAANQPVSRPPPGRWVQSRRQGIRTRWDGGNRHRLIG